MISEENENPETPPNPTKPPSLLFPLVAKTDLRKKPNLLGWTLIAKKPRGQFHSPAPAPRAHKVYKFPPPPRPNTANCVTAAQPTKNTLAKSPTFLDFSP